MKNWILDHLPMCLRSYRPFKKYYWQPEELEKRKRKAEELAEILKKIDEL